jgi:hypothetical protein
LYNRRHTNGTFAPGAIGTVEYNRFIVFIPPVDILRPIHPDRVGVFPFVFFYANMVRKQVPCFCLLIVENGRILNLLSWWK